MAGFVVERHGYLTAAALTAAVVQDMLANGFVQKFPTAALDPTKITGKFRITLEAGGDVDPLNKTDVTEKQPWRICFDLLDAQRLFVYVATPIQLPDDGRVATELTTSNSATDILGAIGAQVGPGSLDNQGNYSGTTDEPTKGLINRARRVDVLGISYPLSYRLVITDRGFWLGVWEDAVSAESASFYNWVLVQRPVDRANGATLVTGKAPVFCVNCCGNLYSQFVVREQDILRPGKRRSASRNEADSEAVLNMQNQVSLSEDGKYVVTFPSRLNTSRYRYPHELDIMGITSSDVVSQYSDVPLQFYGEAQPRIYKALHANGGTNIGMRTLVLQSGGGIS
jgi:hypothetical protein